MEYEFEYFFKKGKEQRLEIEADSLKEAVKKLYDKVGICEWGCITPDGKIYCDDNFPEEKELIMMGC